MRKLNPRQFPQESYHYFPDEDFPAQYPQDRLFSGGGHPQGKYMDPQSSSYYDKPSNIDMLHFTDNPKFNMSSRKVPYDVSTSSPQTPKLFGTSDPSAWRFWVKDRPYAARIKVSGAKMGRGQDLDTSGSMDSETILTKKGMKKAQVTRVSPSRIYRSPYEENDSFDRQQSGEVQPREFKAPRHLKLPGFQRGQMP